MDAHDLPIVTPKKVLTKRGIPESVYGHNKAIICFRSSRVSSRLIERFGGVPLQSRILYHPQLYRSAEFNLLIVPEMIWGGPATAIVVEELFALGVRTLVGFGAGGSINPKIQPGVIFIAQKAICRDGTSREYSDQATCSPDPQLLNHYLDRREELEALLLNGLTTDSLYRETLKKIENWRQSGADFVNLEISPFYVASKVLGIKAIYVGLITDFVGETWDHKYWAVKNEMDAKIIESIYELCTAS